MRDRALAGAATALKERERDDRDDEIARLKSKVGEITMDNEVKIAALEANAAKEADSMSQTLSPSLLWSCARGRSRAPASIALSRRRHRT